MDKKTTSIIAYFSWVGLLIAFLATNDKEGAKFHLNQALVIDLFCLVCIIPIVLFFIPYLGLLFICLDFIWAIFMCVCWIMGLIAAVKQEEKPVPLIGGIKIIK